MATDAQGSNTFKAIGATSDGGYTIGWLYAGKLGPAMYLRHYDAQDEPGATHFLEGTINGANGPSSHPWFSASLAVMADGGAVLAYTVDRQVQRPDGSSQTLSGVYLRRFDANGRMVVQETPLATRTFTPSKFSEWYAQLKVLPLSDGSYVVSWADTSPSETEGRRALIDVQRFSSQNAPLGSVQTIGHGPGALAEPNVTATLTADGYGGFSAAISKSGMETNFQTVLGLWHVGANQQVTQVVAPRAGEGLLMPSSGSNFLLFATDSAGAYRQVINGSGAPVGTRLDLPAMPYTATQRADGTVAAVSPGSNEATVQQFDLQGALVGDAMRAQTQEGKAGIAAAGAGVYLTGWNRTGEQSTQAVYLQRLTAPAPGGGCVAGAPWSSAAMYTAGNVVSYNGGNYQARGVNFSGIVPTDQAYWTAQPCSAPAPAPAPGPAPGPGTCAAAAAWNSQTMYSSGNQVTYNGLVYTARGVNFSNVPPTDQAYWTEASCNAPAPAPAPGPAPAPAPGPGTPACSTLPAWNAQSTYTSGNVVAYSGAAYTARGVNFDGIPPTNEAYWSPSSCAN